jgi:hypothetical protein
VIKVTKSEKARKGDESEKGKTESEAGKLERLQGKRKREREAKAFLGVSPSHFASLSSLPSFPALIEISSARFYRIQ